MSELNEAIENSMRILERADPSSDEYRYALDAVERLHKVQMAAREYDAELNAKEKQHELEAAKLEQEKKHDKWDVGIKIAGVVATFAGIGTTVWGVLKGFRFEETGAIGSSTMKQVFPKLFTGRF